MTVAQEGFENAARKYLEQKAWLSRVQARENRDPLTSLDQDMANCDAAIQQEQEGIRSDIAAADHVRRGIAEKEKQVERELHRLRASQAELAREYAEHEKEAADETCSGDPAIPVDAGPHERLGRTTCRTLGEMRALEARQEGVLLQARADASSASAEAEAADRVVRSMEEELRELEARAASLEKAAQEREEGSLTTAQQVANVTEWYAEMTRMHGRLNGVEAVERGDRCVVFALETEQGATRVTIHLSPRSTAERQAQRADPAAPVLSLPVSVELQPPRCDVDDLVDAAVEEFGKLHRADAGASAVRFVLYGILERLQRL